MENILNKALREVLTPRYSEELRDAFDAGYTPTAAFEKEMQALVRKTDRPPIFRYTKYLAAAAAVLIAVGAAVIVPVIMNSRIDVTPSNTSSTEPPIVTVDTSDTAETNVSESSESSSDEGVVPNTEIGIKDSDDDTTVTTSGDDTAEDINPGSAGDESAEDESAGDESAGDESADDESADDESADNTESSTDTSHENTVTADDAEDDVTVDDDTDTTDSDDDAVVNDDDEDSDSVYDDDESIDDDYDGDDDAAYDDEDDVVVDTSVHITATDGTTLDELLAQNFGGKKLENLYADRANYFPDNGNWGAFEINFRTAEYDFIQDFVHKLGSAKASSEIKESDDDRFMSIGITENKPVIAHPTMSNASAWTHYNTFFAVDEDDSDDEVESDDSDSDDGNISFTVNVYAGTGMVEFAQTVYYFDTETKKSVSYRVDSVFYMDMDEVNKLFEGADKLIIPESAKTVGDIANTFGIKSDNILSSYTNVYHIYDTLLYSARIGSDYIADFFKRYSSKKLLTDAGSQNGDNCVNIKFCTKGGKILFIRMFTSGYCEISDDNKSFYFKPDSGEIEKAIDAVSAASGITIPRWSTLDEYLADKNFTNLTQIFYRTAANGKITYYTLKDKNELKEFTELLKSEFKNAKYTYAPTEYNGSDNIDIYVNGYFNVIKFNAADNILTIRTNSTNRFVLPDGFGAKFKKLLTENEKSAVVSEEIDDYDDDVDSDDTPIDDDIPLSDDDADQNPIT